MIKIRLKYLLILSVMAFYGNYSFTMQSFYDGVAKGVADGINAIKRQQEEQARKEREAIEQQRAEDIATINDRDASEISKKFAADRLKSADDRLAALRKSEVEYNARLNDAMADAAVLPAEGLMIEFIRYQSAAQDKLNKKIASEHARGILEHARGIADANNERYDKLKSLESALSDVELSTDDLQEMKSVLREYNKSANEQHEKAALEYIASENIALKAAKIKSDLEYRTRVAQSRIGFWGFLHFMETKTKMSEVIKLVKLELNKFSQVYANPNASDILKQISGNFILKANEISKKNISIYELEKIINQLRTIYMNFINTLREDSANNKRLNDIVDDINERSWANIDSVLNEAIISVQTEFMQSCVLL